ncbi:MAG: YitT family protein [Bacteroidetes bacterium]|jgi:yitT family protein|nr:YitT family protein [Bacteroidetes oral taxon 274 str. F0058]RKV85577.1 MAG: YitT family protein [Bacteroidota bacterium]
MQVNINKNRIYSELRSYLGITIGLFLYVLAWVAFLIPNEIVGGGATGFATDIHFLTGKAIPINYAFFAVNAILLAIGFYILGNSFGIKTIYGMVFTFLMLTFLPEPTIITNSFQDSDKLICAIIGGIVSGFGIAIAFRNGGSAGGTDIVAMIVSKYKNISPGKVYLYSDLFIIGASFFINFDFRTIVYGYVTMAVFSYSVDLVLSGSRQSVQIFIISKKYDEIARRIINEVNRGVTALDAIGWYSQTSSKVLMVIVRKNDTKQVHQIINETDPEAFISEASVMGVYGKGFDVIKK